MNNSDPSSKSRSDLLQKLAVEMERLPEQALRALLDFVGVWPRQPANEASPPLAPEFPPEVIPASTPADQKLERATPLLLPVSAPQEDDRLSLMGSSDRLGTLDWNRGVPSPVRASLDAGLLEELDRCPGVEQRILGAAKAIAARTVDQLRDLEEVELRCVLLAARAIRAVLLKRSPLGASLVRPMEDREDQALAILDRKRRTGAASSTLVDRTEEVSEWARRLLHEDPLLRDWEGQLPALIEAELPKSSRDGVVYSTGFVGRIDESAQVLLELHPPIDSEAALDIATDGRAVALWFIWRSAVMVDWEPGVAPHWFEVLKQGQSALVRRVKSVALGVEEHRSYLQPEEWVSGFPDVVRRALPKVLGSEISRYRKTRDRILTVARHLLRDLRGDETRRFVRSLGVDEIRALFAVGVALEATRPHGVGLAAAIARLRPVLRARLANLLDIDAELQADDVVGSIRLPPPRVPAELRTLLLADEIEVLSHQADAEHWLSKAGTMLGLDVRRDGIPERHRNRIDDWYRAVEVFLDLAQTFGSGADLPQIMEARRQRDRLSESEQARRDRLADVLRAVSAGEWREVGPLKAAGYRVDAVNPLPPAPRRQILQDLLELDLDFLTGVDGQVHAMAGGPRSRRRRTWILDYLRTFIALHGSRPNYRAAVRKWESDLSWLERKRAD